MYFGHKRVETYKHSDLLISYVLHILNSFFIWFFLFFKEMTLSGLVWKNKNVILKSEIKY